jgi:hypothetical protein
VILKGAEEFSASKLAAPIRVNDASGDVAAPGGGIIYCINRDSGFHPLRHRIPDNAFIPDILDSTQVKLPFPGSMFCDVHQP